VSELHLLKADYTIHRAWRDLGLTGEPARLCRSPRPERHAHGDASPSFSVFDAGRRFKNFATGDTGDVFDFICYVTGWDMRQAFSFAQRQLGEKQGKPASTRSPQRSKAIPRMWRGTEAELRELSDRRGFSTEALRLAEAKGFLRFCTLWEHSAWCVTDTRQQLYEFRRLDGQKWPAYGRLAERKSHCIGSGKRFPVGTFESANYPKIVLVEGAPDLLAACCFIVEEQKVDTVAPVAVLGAGNCYLDPAAVVNFAGKFVCIYPHLDHPGLDAARSWARSLKAAGAARVRAFDLTGAVLIDGSAGKDLADLLRIDADCWEREQKFREVLP